MNQVLTEKQNVYTIPTDWISKEKTCPKLQKHFKTKPKPSLTYPNAHRLVGYPFSRTCHPRVAREGNKFPLGQSDQQRPPRLGWPHGSDQQDAPLDVCVVCRDLA
jgi:hypothetical protein